jgi:hypothetical protein
MYARVTPDLPVDVTAEQMAEHAPSQDWIDRVFLPSRAFLRSRRDQLIPTRKTALRDAAESFHAVEADDLAMRDMALIGLIGEALQAVEDIAWHGLAYERPYDGLANYLRATVYGRNDVNDFWTGAHKWPDDRIDRFAGIAMLDPDSSDPETAAFSTEWSAQFTDVQRISMDAARIATRARVAHLLNLLRRDWLQLSQYYLAFKHGGMILNRDDWAGVDDDVEHVAPETPLYHPSVAVWTKKSGKPYGDFNLTADEVAKWVTGTGDLAIDILECWIASRLAITEAVVVDSRGTFQGMVGFQLPWTIWLREQDLHAEHWDRLGHGPRINWGPEPTPPGGAAAAAFEPNHELDFAGTDGLAKADSPQ